MRRDAVGLQISLDVEGRHALVVGGGEEAVDKARRLLDGGAWVTVVAPAPVEALVALERAGQAMLKRRDLVDGDVASAHLVLVCERDAELARRARDLAEEAGAAFWACDDPEISQLAMPAVARLGRARIAVSTGGAAPALAGRLRLALEEGLGERFAAFVDRLGRARDRILAEEPDPDRRRERLRALVAGFALRVEATYPDDDCDA